MSSTKVPNIPLFARKTLILVFLYCLNTEQMTHHVWETFN